MADGPKYRRKNRPAAPDPSDALTPRPTTAEVAPIPPLETREQRLARRARQAEAEMQAAQDARRRQIEADRAEAEQRNRLKAEAEAKAEREAAERRKQAEDEARRKAEEVARAKAEAQAKAEREAAERRKRAEEDARRKQADEAARAKAKAQAKAEREAAERRQRAEEDARRKQAEEVARAKAEAQAKAEREAAERRKRAEEDARRKRAEEAARAKAEAQAKAEREAAERRQREEEDARRKQAEETARAKAEAQAKAEREAAERRKREEEDARRKQAAATRSEAEAQSLAVTNAMRQNDTAPPAELPPAPAPVLALDPERRVSDAVVAPQDAASGWQRLGTFDLDARMLERNRIITAARQDPAHTTFDVLRTRLLQALAERGWSRVAITSPTKGCGKTFTAANLAISLARQENCATLLLDLDMRAPTLHKTFGQKSVGSIGDMLRGRVDPADHLRRPGPNAMNVGRNIAFGFNDVTEDYASELLQDPVTAQTLKTMTDTLRPDVVIYDMPPALSSDDVIAFRAHFDAVLLVVGGGLTTDAEVKDVERRLGEQTPLLGMVLNRAEGTNPAKYAY